MESVEAAPASEDITAAFNPASLPDGLHPIDTEYTQLSFPAPGKPIVLMPRPPLDSPA